MTKERLLEDILGLRNLAMKLEIMDPTSPLAVTLRKQASDLVADYERLVKGLVVTSK